MITPSMAADNAWWLISALLLSAGVVIDRYIRSHSSALNSDPEPLCFEASALVVVGIFVGHFL